MKKKERQLVFGVTRGVALKKCSPRNKKRKRALEEFTWLVADSDQLASNAMEGMICSSSSSSTTKWYFFDRPEWSERMGIVGDPEMPRGWVDRPSRNQNLTHILGLQTQRSLPKVRR